MQLASRLVPVSLLLALACSACVTEPNAVAPQPLSQPEDEWQALSEAPAGEASRLRHRCRRISQAQAAAKSPLALNLKPIRADDVAWSNLGALEYDGQGVEVSSDDPRFASLMIEPGHVWPRLPTGDFIQIDVYVPYGAETESARCFAPWNPTDIHPQADTPLEPPAGVSEALGRYRHLRLHGAAPLTASRWIALMGDDDAGTKLILADADGSSSELADLPFGFQVIQPVLDPHSFRRWVRLAGRARRDEPFRVVILDVPASLF